MKITAKMLRDLDACEEEVEVFERLWPTGAYVTCANVAIARAHALDIDWFIAQLWPPAILMSYDNEALRLFREYERQRNRILDEHYGNCDRPMPCQRCEHGIPRRYSVICRRLHQEAMAICDAALAAVQAKMNAGFDASFVRHWKQYLKWRRDNA